MISHERIFSMKNLTAYVTGASRGIGRAIALRLAREGCRLVICSRGEEMLLKTKADIEALGTDCLAITADVGDPSDCEQLFDAARSFGTPDLLINNAGISRIGLLQDMCDKVSLAAKVGNVPPQARTKHAMAFT